MRATLTCFVAVLAVCATSCDDAAVARCADGAALHVIDDHAYCVYAAGAGPERGTCPPDVPALVVRRGVTVCTDDPDPTASSFGDLCMQPGVTCASGGTEGWSQLPGTQLIDVCPTRPDIHGVVGCEAVVSGWSGGVADTLHDRLLVWGGGGGSNYFGNEVYALDVRAGAVARLTEPSDPALDGCPGVLPDARPSSRATYDSLAFVAHTGRMFAWGGQVAGDGCGTVGDTWTFDATTLEWDEQTARADQPLSREGIGASDYDPDTRLVFLHDTHNLFSYESESAAFTHLLTSDLAPQSYSFVGRVDVVGRRFVVIGGVATSFDLTPGANYAPTELSLEGCEELVDTNYPGLAYDPIAQKLVGWAGGGTIYVIDAVADTCEARTIEGGPRSPQMNGTNGRFRYFASLDAFVLINAIDEDAWVLRLRGE